MNGLSPVIYCMNKHTVNVSYLYLKIETDTRTTSAFTPVLVPDEVSVNVCLEDVQQGVFLACPMSLLLQFGLSCAGRGVE